MSRGGSFAEYAVPPEAKLAPKPTNLTYEQGVAVPISGLTALQGLRDSGKVLARQHVLVTGAAGGVGSYGVQPAKALGAEVTGVCSTGKVDLVRWIGADHVIDYTREEITDGGRRYDAILDTGGARPLPLPWSALMSRATPVVVGSETGGKWLGGIDRSARAALPSPFVPQKLVMLISTERHEDLLDLTELIEAGKVSPVVDRTFPLAEVPEVLVTWPRGGPGARS